MAKILNRQDREPNKMLESTFRKLSESAVAVKDAVVDRGATTTTVIIDTATTATTAVRSATETAAKKVVDASRTAVGGRGQAEKYVIVEELPDVLKLGYVNTLVALTCFDDGQIDEREVCEIQVLMAQLRCSTEVRQAVRSGIDDPASLEAEAEIAKMLAQTPEGMQQALSCSLIKDAIRLDRAKSDEGSAREHSGIRRLARLLDLDDEKVEFIESACIEDEKILAGELSDAQVVEAAKTMVAQASAVGVPVAAVYLSGSVTGLSAAGVTSGLAALGLGGVLGLSAMVSGIGVAIIGGVGAYKAVQWVMGGAERDRAFRRELMLQEVLRIHQKSMANLAADIAFFAERLTRLSLKVAENRAVIDKLSREMTLLTGALTRLRTRESRYERDLDEEINRRTKRVDEQETQSQTDETGTGSDGWRDEQARSPGS